MNFKNPNIISFAILLFILAFALIVAYLFYQEQPEGTTFLVEGTEFSIPYPLGKPHQQHFLPSQLREISGLAWEGNNQLLAIQDETGIVYKYDLERQEIIQQVKFGKNLDYEGVARDQNRVYVLERDGDIFEIDSLSGETVESKKFETALSYQHNAEGLGYDPEDNCLLVALKDAALNEKSTGQGIKREIYSFDVVDHRLSEQPLYYIDQLELGRLIYNKEKSYEFRPSGIAVHPQNGYIYVISSVGRLLVVINRTGQLVFAERLDPSLLPQPEGIAFDPEGRLFIASEGRNGQGRILVYNPQQ